MAEENDYVEIYIDESGEYRWKRIAGGNYETLAGPQEGYKDIRDCIANAFRVNGQDIQVINKTGKDF